MKSNISRADTVYICLMVATLMAMALSTGEARDLLGVHGAAGLATVIAFVKARYVMLDFMELRNTGMQRGFDVWLLAVGLGSLALIVR